MSKKFSRTASWCLAGMFFLASGSVSLCQGTQDQDRPDAPTPKFAADADEFPLFDAANWSVQGPAGYGGSASGQTTQPRDRKKSYFERFLGFHMNLEPFEPPDNAPPLSVKQKYAYAFHEAEDFKAHVGNVFQAAIQQGFDSQPHYGQGWGPYAQRYGAAEADQVTSCFFIYVFFPHLLKTDPRYFRRKTGSIWSRMNYAASRTLIATKDSGGSTFNTPQVLGQLFQTGISTAYYPQRDRDPGQVFQSWGLSLLLNSGYNIATEFYPDILRKVFHRK